ncbi:MAG: tripartite tricarboxylate transporter permease, partial [Balneolaceae bacterium]
APFTLMARRKRDFFRSGVIGSLIGMLPGAGADMGSWVSLAASKRASNDPDQYGKGSLEGISDATVANNSALAGTWIPAMVFGIPGDSITAIVIGVLLMKNLNPGPDIFIDQPVLVYSIYTAFFMANLVLLVVGYFAIKAGRFVVKVPQRILLPLIVLFCIIGSFAIQGSYFDVGIMLFMGVLGFVLERRGISLGPVVLGIILGGPLEERFIQTITGSEGIIIPFFDRPIAAGLGALFLLLWGWIVWQNTRNRSSEKDS